MQIFNPAEILVTNTAKHRGKIRFYKVTKNQDGTTAETTLLTLQVPPNTDQLYKCTAESEAIPIRENEELKLECWNARVDRITMYAGDGILKASSLKEMSTYKPLNIYDRHRRQINLRLRGGKIDVQE